jgi:type II secretory pathway component PulM
MIGLEGNPVWQRASNYWQHSQAREKYLLIAGSIISVSILSWLLVFQPLNNALKKQQRIQTSLISQLNLARQSAQQLNSSAPPIELSTTPGIAINISQIISRSLAAHNLRLNNYQPNGKNSATIQFDTMAFQQLLPWLRDVDQSKALHLQQLKIKSLDKPGQVSAYIGLGITDEN